MISLMTTPTRGVYSAGAGLLAHVRPAWWGVASLAILTVFFSTTQSGTTLFIFNLALLTSLGSIALNILIGTSGQLSIGNAAFLGLGAFTTVLLIQMGQPPAVAILGAVLAAATSGAVVAIPALRLRGFYVALTTLSLHFIVVFILHEYQSKQFGPAGYISLPAFSEHGLDGGQRRWAWVLFGCLAVTILIASRLIRGRLGRAWRMIRDHEDAAAVLGIAVGPYKIAAFVITSAIIGLQGGITVYFTGAVNAESFTLIVAISYITMVVIGGLDSIAGAVIGASVIAALPTIVTDILSQTSGGEFAQSNGPPISQMIYGALLVAFVISTPDGLMGLVRRGRRWALGRLGHGADGGS